MLRPKRKVKALILSAQTKQPKAFTPWAVLFYEVINRISVFNRITVINRIKVVNRITVFNRVAAMQAS